MKKYYWKNLLIVVGIVFAALYFFNPKKEIVKVPVTIEVEVPKIVKEFDTIYKPKPIYITKGSDTIKEIDSTYYNKYIALQNDSIKQDSLFKKAIAINTYKEKIEDDTLKIDLTMKLRGKLLNYQVGYEIKPRTVKVDTTLNIPIPTKAKLFVGGGVRMPVNQLNPNIGASLVPYAGVYLKTKGDNLINVTIDKNYIGVGYAWKLKLGKKNK